MGSGSSSPKNDPSETQSAPPTAKSTPAAPKRNRQFQEVQLGGQSGGTPPSTRQRARATVPARSQGASPSQPTGPSRPQKGQDPGAAGMTNGKQVAATRAKHTAKGNSNSKNPSSTQQANTVSKNKVRAEVITEANNETSTKDDDDPNAALVNDLVKPGENSATESSDEREANKTEASKPPDGVNGEGASTELVVKELGTTVIADSNGAFSEIPNAVKDVGDNGGATHDLEKEDTHSGDHNTHISHDDDLSVDAHHEELSDHDFGGNHDDKHSHDADHDELSHAGDEDVISVKDDDLVFETFYHRSGKEFQCIYQGGMRFYLDDWGSKEWQPFPKRWYSEGLLVTNTILKDDGAQVEAGNDGGGAASSSQGQSRSRGQAGAGGGNSSDDREGFIMHPTQGRIPTYIFYKKHNVHMYFDKNTGAWVRMPIGWELHHPMVKTLVDQVEEAVPSWGDRHDILSLLRACNYDSDECISIYLHLEKDAWMKVPRTSKEAKSQDDKESRMNDLEQRVRDLQIELEKEKTARSLAENRLEDQTTKFTELEVETKQAEAQLSAATGGRPKTARPISVMKGGKGFKGGKSVKGGRQVPAGEVVNPDDVLDLNATAMDLRKSHTRLKMDMGRYMGDMKDMLLQMKPVIGKMKSSGQGQLAEIEEVRTLYRKEALQRKLLYNQLQELRGNIRVFCRARKDDRAQNCLKFITEPDQEVVVTNPQQGKKQFVFDKVYDDRSTQEQIFEDTKPIISSCADGYNVSLMAYGQTGSGKTYTMMGPENNPGINIRAMKELFNVCEERSQTQKYVLTVSLVEIYNEHVQDLLQNDARVLELRTAGNKVSIPGLTEYPIKNVGDVKKVMAMGDKNRKVASTMMNSQSSRSHLVLMLAVEGHDKVTNAVSRGTLTLVDLAGSERIAKSEAEGQRLVEAAAINKSLSALGQVFTALRTSQLHIPYRNSKLTQILQPSLGGDAKACLFVNISPDSYNYPETISTLSFGSNARQVALGQAKQNVSKGNR